jgi:hypothetical protein
MLQLTVTATIGPPDGRDDGRDDEYLGRPED